MNFVSLWVESRDSPVCTGLTLALRPQEAGRWPVTSLHACFSRVPPLVLTGRCPNFVFDGSPLHSNGLKGALQL